LLLAARPALTSFPGGLTVVFGLLFTPALWINMMVRVEVKNVWSSTSGSSTCLRDMVQDSFIFYCYIGTAIN
jgi:hypothetical protein